MADSWGEEKPLVEAAQAGDRAALSALFNTYFTRVYRYMLARTGHPQDAEDLAQEVFLRMLDGLPRYQWRDVPFTAWLFKIAHNIVVSRYRRNGLASGRLTPLSDSLVLPTTLGPEEEIATRLALDEVVQLAQQLPPMQRQVIELRLVAGLSVAETAQVLRKTENNIKVVQHKAIGRLRQIITALNGGSQE